MDNTPITRAEHGEFARRIDEENTRQNHRIEALEKTVEQIHALTVSVEKLAVSVEQMVEEQKQQGERLTVIEGRDGEMWRKGLFEVLKIGAAIIIGYLFSQVGF